MNFKITFVVWPRRLVRRDESNFLRFIGWVWMQKARLVRNLNHGWIAHVEDQTEARLSICPCCNKPLEGSE
jgi:hypothetical protein